jgi:large subunit ribosomal protein L10
MLKKDKERIVTELAERLRTADSLIVTDYRGLSVTDIDDLRTKLLEQGVRYTVVKNTLTKIAAEQAGASELVELLDGPTAIAFLETDADPAAAAKVLNDVANVGRVLVIRGGVLQGKQMTDADVKNLASLPGMDVLRSQLAGAVVGPLTMVVGLFTAPLRDLAGVIDARIRQLEEQGDGPAASAEPPAADADGTESAAGSEADIAAAPHDVEENAPEAEAEATTESESQSEQGQEEQ